MTGRPVPLFMMVCLLCSLIMPGCLDQAGNNTVLPTGACPEKSVVEEQQYTIMRGEPFLYNGTIRARDNKTVQATVRVHEDKTTILSESVPVNPDGSFTFRLGSGKTERMTYSSAVYVFENTNFTIKPDLFDLLFDSSTGSERVRLSIIESPVDDRCRQIPVLIAIDPVDPVETSAGNHSRLTRPLTIHGTTSLPAGDTITVWVQALPSSPCMKTAPQNSIISHCNHGLQQKALVGTDMCGRNTWSFELNTSYSLPNPEYRVIAESANASLMNCSTIDSVRFRTQSDDPDYQDPNGPRVVYISQ